MAAEKQLQEKNTSSIFRHQYLPEQFSNGKQGGALPPQEQPGLVIISAGRGHKEESLEKA